MACKISMEKSAYIKTARTTESHLGEKNVMSIPHNFPKFISGGLKNWNALIEENLSLGRINLSMS